MMSDEQQEMNPNQEAFLDFLKEHYQKDGEENSMSDEAVESLAEELNQMREGGSAGIEEVTKLLQEKTPEGEPKAAARQIRPEGVVCIKTWDVENNKVIFNICKSDSVEPPELVMRDGEEQTRLPMSLGAPSDDVDRKGEPCVIYDVVFNPETLENTDYTYMQFIVELTMMRVEEKYPERPKLNAKRSFKKLRQREWKGREIAEQNIRNEAQMRLVDDESGLREFSTPEAAEPTWQVMMVKRHRDAESVLRLRVELPGLRPEEVHVQLSAEFVRVVGLQLGEVKYKIEAPCQRPESFIMLSKRFHLSNHTLTLVWGPPSCKEFDEMMALKAAEAAKSAEEARRIQLANDVMFDIDCSDDD